MNDRNANGNLPRIPKPGTLVLDIDQDSLRLYSTEDEHHGGQRVTVDEVYLVDVGSGGSSGRIIDESCLSWALDAAECGGFQALGYREITPTKYVIEGPVRTVDRLMLIQDDDGYQLHDMSTQPPTAIDLGIQTPHLGEDEMISVAAMCAENLGYHLLGYRKITNSHWRLSEPLSLSSLVDGAVLLNFETALLDAEFESTKKDLWLIAVLMTSFCLGVSIVAAMDGFWIALVPSCAGVLVGYLLTRPRRWYTWSCEVCHGEGVIFTGRCRSGREAREARTEHLRRFHGQPSA